MYMYWLFIIINPTNVLVFVVAMLFSLSSGNNMYEERHVTHLNTIVIVSPFH